VAHYFILLRIDHPGQHADAETALKMTFIGLENTVAQHISGGTQQAQLPPSIYRLFNTETKIDIYNAAMAALIAAKVVGYVVVFEADVEDIVFP
jgi:hypothetical protein